MAGHLRAQEALEITLNDLADNREFYLNEVVITVVGKRATQCSWDVIQKTLNRPSRAEEDRFHQVYTLEDPMRPFLITNKPEADLLNKVIKNSKQPVILSLL